MPTCLVGAIKDNAMQERYIKCKRNETDSIIIYWDEKNKITWHVIIFRGIIINLSN